MEFRREEPGDEEAIRQVNEAAFERPDEAGLVELLRDIADPYVSMVALVDGEIVGHVIFSPVTIDEGDGNELFMGLAPMAVHPDHQSEGIGTALGEAGLEECRQMGVRAVFVLGPPAFYSRFGFESARDHGFDYPGDVPEDAFMVHALADNALEGRSGEVRYLPVIADYE